MEIMKKYAHKIIFFTFNIIKNLCNAMNYVKNTRPKVTAMKVEGMNMVKKGPQCEIFIEWEGLWCPCCERLLRTKPRSTRPKRRLSLRKRDREVD